MISDVLLAFDHFTHTVTVLANVYTGDGDVDARYADAVAAIADVRERLAAPVPRARAGRREPPEYRSNMGADGYAAAVERVKEYIRAGDAYQVVPSQRWSAELPCDAFSVYRGLRTVNPSPYMYFLDFEDFEIAGASPESLIKITGRRAEQRPIAGTRPRADTVEEDLERAGGSRTRRSAPSTRCSSTSAATTWAASASTAASRSTSTWSSRPTRTSCT